MSTESSNATMTAAKQSANVTAAYTHTTHKESFDSSTCAAPVRDPHRDAPSECSNTELGQLRYKVTAMQAEINRFLTGRMNLGDQAADLEEDEELDDEQEM